MRLCYMCEVCLCDERWGKRRLPCPPLQSWLLAPYSHGPGLPYLPAGPNRHAKRGRVLIPEENGLCAHHQLSRLHPALWGLRSDSSTFCRNGLVGSACHVLADICSLLYPGDRWVAFPYGRPGRHPQAWDARGLFWSRFVSLGFVVYRAPPVNIAAMFP